MNLKGHLAEIQNTAEIEEIENTIVKWKNTNSSLQNIPQIQDHLKRY